MTQVRHDPCKLREAAVHEAGHTVMMELLDIPYDRVSIAHGLPRCAWIWVSGVERATGPVQRAFMALMAGVVAQRLLLDRHVDTQRRYTAESDHDLALAARLLRSVTDDARENTRLLRETLDRLKPNACPIDAIANRLLAQPTLTRREVGEILGETLVGCEPVMS
jgi:hypothetical protein